jgi:hypothetical protein
MLADFCANSLIATGTANAPGAGSSFVTLAAPRAGTYNIKIYYTITGAAEVAGLNVRLVYNTSASKDFPSGGLNAVLALELEQINLDGSSSVQLRAAAAATASTVYSGVIIATQIT